MTQDSRKIIFIYISERGRRLTEKLRVFYPDASVTKLESKLVDSLWTQNNSLVFVMATGIVVRIIAHLLHDKEKDPAVLVIDEKGHFVIPLCGGHVAGANQLAKEMATLLGAQAVISSASDIWGIEALDLWAKKIGFRIVNKSNLPIVQERLLSQKKVFVFIDKNVQINLLDGMEIVKDPQKADLLISNRKFSNLEEKLYFVPQNLFVGIGFHDYISPEYLKKSLEKWLESLGFWPQAIKAIATLKRKAQHPVLILLKEAWGVEVLGYSEEELKRVGSLSSSEKVKKTIGIDSLSEQAALLASGGELIVPKKAFKDITFALAEATFKPKGKLYIVGIGPGNLDLISPRAIRALRESDVIIGYSTYVKLIEPIVKDKRVLLYSMTYEVERAKMAIEEAQNGKIVSLVSGGDPGVYGIAGIVFELLENNDIDVEVIPGISSPNAAASLVGAPLIGDFSVISLSDRLVPWEVIENKLRGAAAADFILVLLNPRSKSRDKIKELKAILLQYKSPDTPVAIVKNAYREGCRFWITSLADFDNYPIEMDTTIIIGNSQTVVKGSHIITSRGYKLSELTNY